MGDEGTSSPEVMASSGASPAIPSGTPKKSIAAKPKNPRAKQTHPKTGEMVNAAINALKERGGSSVQAIKKYMAGTYMIDTAKQATFIKKYLKAAVASGVLVQTKGKGAAGSFKLSSTKQDTVKSKVKSATKAAAPKKPSVAKKPGTAKKPASTAAKKALPKKTTVTAVTEKKTVSKGPAAKPPKTKTTAAKPAPKLPAKAKPVATTKRKPAVPKPKKAAPKKAAVSKN